MPGTLALAMGAVSAPLSISENRGVALLIAFALAHAACCLMAMAGFGHQPRKQGRRRKSERERRELWERTSRKVDEIVAKYHARFPREMAKSVGAVKTVAVGSQGGDHPRAHLHRRAGKRGSDLKIVVSFEQLLGLAVVAVNRFGVQQQSPG